MSRVHFAHELAGHGIRPVPRELRDVFRDPPPGPLPRCDEDPPAWREPEWEDERDQRIRNLEQQFADTQRRLAGHLSAPSWNVMGRVHWDSHHTSPWFGPFRNVTAFREWRQKVKREWMAKHCEPFPYKIDHAYTRDVCEVEMWLRGKR